MERDNTLAAALEKLDVRKGFSTAAPAAMTRFRDSLKAANPHLNEDQLEAYVEHFSTQLPILTDTMVSEHVSTLSESLSDEEQEVLREFAGHPKVRIFVEVLQKNSAQMAIVAQKVIREDGVRVHKQSFDAALNTL